MNWRHGRNETRSRFTVPAYSSGEELEAAEFTLRVVNRQAGGVYGLRQDQEQTMHGKEEEVEEQQSPQKEEVGEHPWSEACAQPLYGGVPQRQRAEVKEAAQ